MPISADQWRVVIGCNNVRRHRQIDLKQFCLEKMIFGGSSIQLDLSDLSQLDAVVQEVRKDAETSHSATLNDFILDDSLDELSVISMTVCCHILCVEVLQCFLSMVKLQLLQLAGDVETNPGPGTETPEYRTMVSCTKVLTDSIAHGVSGISDSLFAGSIISDETHQEMMNNSLAGYKKAAILIKDVSDRIKLNPDKFHTFVAALKEEGPSANDIVSHVLKAYNSIKASAPPQSQRTPPSRSADESRSIVNDIARHHGVDSLLDQKCTDYHILPISKCIVHWNAYGQYLGLSPQHIHAINTNRLNTLPNSKAKEMLHKWQEMCSAIKCTYRYLLQGIIEVENNRRLVGDICTIIAKPSPSCTNDEDDFILKISLSPHKRADKPQSAKADERAKETEPFKEDNVNYVPQAFCELPPPSTVETQSSEEGVDEEDSICAPAQVATGKLWPINHDVLRFYIINPDDLARVGLNADNIKSWAEKWDQHPYSNVIPKLRPTRDSNSDIRIKINPNGRSWSKVGVDAELVDEFKPTMVLGFVKGRSDYNQHIVIHEFGHALGMEHEHQRSIFWSVAKKFIDDDKMKKDKRLKNTDINGDYLKSLQRGDGSGKYDPDSVMHYWFDKEWLKSAKHRDKNKVNSDKSLSDEERNVILGIHKRDNSLAACPSPIDFAFLAECYKKKAVLPLHVGSVFDQPAHTQVNIDEAYARQLQAQYDQESTTAQQHPPHMVVRDDTLLLPKDTNDQIGNQSAGVADSHAEPTINSLTNTMEKGQQENFSPQLKVPPAINQATGFTSFERDMASNGCTKSPSLDPKILCAPKPLVLSGKHTIATEIKRVSDLATKMGKTDAREQLQEISLILGSSVTKVGVIGASNSGKSTTLNALIGDKFLPSSSGGTTAHILCIKHNCEFPNGKMLDSKGKELANERRCILDKLSQVNETQRTVTQSSTSSNSVAVFELQVSIPFLSKHPDINLELYDTPGTSEGEQSQIYRDTMQTIEKMEGLLLILSQDTVLLDPTNQLVKTLRKKYPLLMNPKQPRILVIVNKYDLFFDDDEDEDGYNETTEEKIRKISVKTEFPLQNIVFYSARHGLRARKWRADVASVKPSQYEETKVAIRKMKNEEVIELEKTDLTFEQKVEKMSDIATSVSRIEEVEKSIVKSCSMFKPLKAIDDTLKIICKLLEDVQQQERERKMSDSEKQEAAGWSEDLEKLKLKFEGF